MARFLNLLHRWEFRSSIRKRRRSWLGGERTDVPGCWTRRYEEEAVLALDRRLGKASASGFRPTGRRSERLYRERYLGFDAVKHFHEHLIKDHGFGWGCTIEAASAVEGRCRKEGRARGAHRRKQRRFLPGMMLHQDGSRHAGLQAGPRSTDRHG